MQTCGWDLILGRAGLEAGPGCELGMGKAWTKDRKRLWIALVHNKEVSPCSLWP